MPRILRKMVIFSLIVHKTGQLLNDTESRLPKTFAPYVRNGVIKVLTNINFNEEFKYDAVNQSLRRTKYILWTVESTWLKHLSCEFNQNPRFFTEFT